MTNDLVSENSQLRAQLKSLLEQAHRNQQIMKRYQEFDLQFISSNTFQELIDSVFDTLTEASALDVVTLTLIDPEAEIRRILTDLRIDRSEEHTSELQSLMRISYAVFCLKKNTNTVTK